MTLETQQRQQAHIFRLQLLSAVLVIRKDYYSNYVIKCIISMIRLAPHATSCLCYG